MLTRHYAVLETDDRGIYETRGNACEIVAGRFLTHLSESERIDYLLLELPPVTGRQVCQTSNGTSDASRDEAIEPPRSSSYDENSSLVFSQVSSIHEQVAMDMHYSSPLKDNVNKSESNTPEADPAKQFVGLNALEIAAIVNAKIFLSQRAVQKIVNGIWCGEIVFWDSLSVQAKKKAQKCNKRYDLNTSMDSGIECSQVKTTYCFSYVPSYAVK